MRFSLGNSDLLKTAFIFQSSALASRYYGVPDLLCSPAPQFWTLCRVMLLDGKEDEKSAPKSECVLASHNHPGRTGEQEGVSGVRFANSPRVPLQSCSAGASGHPLNRAGVHAAIFSPGGQMGQAAVMFQLRLVLGFKVTSAEAQEADKAVPVPVPGPCGDALTPLCRAFCLQAS